MEEKSLETMSKELESIITNSDHKLKAIVKECVKYINANNRVLEKHFKVYIEKNNYKYVEFLNGIVDKIKNRVKNEFSSDLKKNDKLQAELESVLSDLAVFFNSKTKDFSYNMMLKNKGYSLSVNSEISKISKFGYNESGVKTHYDAQLLANSFIEEYFK